MGRPRVLLAMAALVCLVPAQASAATLTIQDVKPGFFAHQQIYWVVSHDWLGVHANHTFTPGDDATRQSAARVLAMLNQQQNAQPMASDPYGQAVDAGWIGAGSGPRDTITQLQFDRGVVRVMGLSNDVTHLARITGADGWRPKLRKGFGTEQIVRDIGARWNIPFGADSWETWPGSTMLRANLAIEAYQLAHLSPYWGYAVSTQLNVVHQLPKYPPLKQAVLGNAFRWAGAPYIWGGTSDHPQTLFGLPAAGGFDCSGFVWWVMKRSYTAGGTTWDGTSQIPWRTTYDMAAHVPVSKRIIYRNLKPGDILFWSSDPHGIHTASGTVYHTGIYLGNGWTINSHGSGAGVTIDYMAPGAGWYHDAFAFGWRVMPRGV